MKKKIFFVVIFFLCTIGVLNIVYARYILTREFDINIKTAPFYFEAEANQDNIEMNNNVATVEITIKNYNLDDVNEYDTNYEVSLKENQFEVSIENSDSEVQTITGGTAQDDNITVKFVPTESTTLNSEKEVTLEIISTSPYTKVIEIPITIKRTFTLADLIEGGLAEKYLEENITVKDENGDAITVPSGFKVTDETDNVSEGIVIQDENENEYVWVPCSTDGTNLNTYAQNFKYNDGTNASLQWYYFFDPSNTSTKYYWDDTGSGEYEIPIETRKASVDSYKGFYVGRYEAGWPEELTNGSTYTNATVKNVNNKIPVSKKGVAVWNYINQENALYVSSKMYDSSSSVTSSLIDSYAWDTVMTWIENDSNYSGMLVDSTSYGNYYNHIESDYINASLYAEHLIVGSGREVASNYYSGNLQMPNGTLAKVVELAAGTLEAAKVKNIYDMAGNIYEWTTEKNERDSSTYIVRRGGSFNLDGNADPISIRVGAYQNNVTDFDFGFRVVFYIK